MSRRGEFQQVDQVVEPQVSPTRIGIREVVIKLPGGTNRHLVDPGAFEARTLAAELADAWVTISARIAGSSLDQRRAIVVFLQSIDRQTGGKDVSLRDLTREHLNVWENELVAKQQAHPTPTPHRYAIHL